MTDEVGSWRCGRCFDIGFVYETVDEREQVSPCVCRAKHTGPADPLEACRVPPAYRQYTLGNYDPRTATQQAALEAALAYSQEFPHGASDRGLGLLFWGAKGTGKTHLAVAVLQELVANKGVSASFWDFGTLVKEISRSYDKSTFTTELSTLGSAIDVDLLLLDDLASRRMHDWMHNTLFEIVDARYRARRPTLITTIYEDGDRETALAGKANRWEEFLVERIGQRVYSRLLEMCLMVPTQSAAERAKQRPTLPPRDLRGLRRYWETKDPD